MNTPIAAISTPHGKGGIAVIRISGDGAVATASKMFSPKKQPLTSAEHASAVFGDIVRNGKVIDTGIATVFFAPHSFTGLETVEISCHGGVLITESVLAAAFEAGCRPAEPGEFTKLAYLNGKISLDEAEGIAGLIDAKTSSGLEISSSQSRGLLKKSIASLRSQLLKLTSSLYAVIDYPDEDMSDIPAADMPLEVAHAIEQIKKLLGSYGTARAMCEGIVTVLCGRPNTGKSSLMNLILGRDRAIVTSEEGTTRDTIEEEVTFGSVLLRLVDTAGIRDCESKAEHIGVERAIEQISSAELVLAVFDGSAAASDNDISFIEMLEELKKGGRQSVVILMNKSDLEPKFDLRERLSKIADIIDISAVSKDGEDKLKDKINGLYIDGSISPDTDAVVANARQYAALSKALEALERAKNALLDDMPPDVASLDIELALSSLGEVDGRTVADEIVNEIFSHFCVGK